MSAKGSWMRKCAIPLQEKDKREAAIFGTWTTISTNGDALYEGKSRLDCRQWACSNVDGNGWTVDRIK